MKIEHFQTCTAAYPEKPEGEKPQEEVVIPLDEDGEEIHQCSDCGAFVIVRIE